VAVLGARPEPRITLTFPVLGSARHVVFLAAGAAKQAIVARLAAGEDLPAGRVRATGTLHWMLDRAAAGEI
jgi:6-phosphogluconolactonase